MRRTWLLPRRLGQEAVGVAGQPTAPSPKRMRGISGDLVPFQLSQDGTQDHQWKPDG